MNGQKLRMAYLSQSWFRCPEAWYQPCPGRKFIFGSGPLRLGMSLVQEEVTNSSEVKVLPSLG